MSDDKKDVTEDSETEEEASSAEEGSEEEEQSTGEGSEEGSKDDGDQESDDDASDDEATDDDAEDDEASDDDADGDDEAAEADDDDEASEDEADDDEESEDEEEPEDEADDEESEDEADDEESEDEADDEDAEDEEEPEDEADDEDAQDEEEPEDEADDDDEDAEDESHDDHDHDDHGQDEDVLGIAAFFDHPDHLIYAAGQAREASYEKYDAFSPFPIHGMDDAMGLGRSWIPWVTFLAGVTGFSTANFIQFGIMWYDWPMVFGGKPFAAWPSFVPVMFELTVLLAGVTTALVMLYAAGCFRKPMIIDPGITNDRFVLWVSADDERFSQDAVVEFMKGLNPMEIRTVRKEGES